MKKICGILACLFIWFLIFVPNFSDARSIFKQPDWYQHQEQKVDPAKLDDDEMSSIEEWIHYENSKQEWVLQFPQKENYSTTLWYAIRLIQVSINRALWILATVALIYMLYCWFLVLSSWADGKNAQNGKKWIKTAAIALAWIGLAWLIVSVMIRFITMLTSK